jgi:hypothetical protein
VIRRELAYNHPVIITVFYVMIFAVSSALFNNPLTALISAAAGAVVLALTVMWMRSLYCVSLKVVGGEPPGSTDKAFVVFSVIAPISYFGLGWVAFAWPRVPIELLNLALWGIVIGYGALTWVTATAFVSAEQRKPSPRAGHVIIPFLLLFHLPIGVWVLRSRIKRFEIGFPVAA